MTTHQFQPPFQSPPQPPSQPPSQATELLSTAEEILALSNILKEHKIIAFDTEFIRESTFFPIVEIIQVATESQSWLVDARAFKKNHKAGEPQAYDPALNPLLEVFRDPEVLKVVHAAQGDQECLYTSFGIVASPTLDTAVAASLCGYGDGVGLGRLLQSVLDVTVQKGHARTNWSVRPLPKQLAEYAHSDVLHLVALGQKLLSQLEVIGRKNWALELSAKWEDTRLYQADVEGMTQKLARGKRLDKSSYAALVRLVQWRESRVRQVNLPRRWVADDQVLLDLAQVRPKDLAHLGTFRGLNKGELKTSGQSILDALQSALTDQTQEEFKLPKTSKPLIPTQEESQVLEVLRCFIGILADRHKIAAKHLMTTAKLLPLLRSQVVSVEQLAETKILSEEATRLIGQELIAMMQGKRALVIQSGRHGNQIEIRDLE